MITALDFGGQGVGTTSAPATVTVSNPSGAPLLISGVAASDAFTVTNACPVTLAPGSSCALSISFSPTAIGDASGVLTISDNASGGPQNVPVHAHCLLPTAFCFTTRRLHLRRTHCCPRSNREP